MPNPVGRISGPLLRNNLTRTEDLAFETDLLYINHSGNRIGINTDSPTRTLQVNGLTRITGTVNATDTATFGNMLFANASISAQIGPISITAGSSIATPQLRVGDTYFNNNELGTYSTNTDLQLQANGTGYVYIPSSVEVYGSINATGDIVADGNIVLGSDDTDSVNIAADIDSDIMPDITAAPSTASVITSGACPETWAVPRTLSVIGVLNGKNQYNYFDEYLEWTGAYWKYYNTTIGPGAYYQGAENVTYPWQVQTWTAVGVGVPVPIFDQASATGYNLGGDPNKQWDEINAVSGNIAGNIAVSNLVSIGGITVNLPIDNTFYVSSQGLNTNPGQTVSFAFETVQFALAAAATAGGNNLIHILPGTYTENFPLTLPANTTIKGHSIRSVKIQPTSATQSADAFLLDSGCQITDLTVSNFYYDSVGNTGHAFRFVNNINIISKSPYVQNVTVSTQGSLTSVGDPRGYDSHDAGRGALVDGSVANAGSNQASMLFNAVTFITPGVDAITMTNGVRVEWIDCFTYFANRSLYATNGAAGFASIGSVFGAEVRVIASASVYGAVGAEADGADTLMYLINHNMAYVGSGKDVTNDRSLIDQTKETVELNSGKIYYQSQDQSGNFRVGDTFVVDFDTGFVNLAPGSFAFNGSNLTVGTPGSQTFIDAEKITLPNFTISGNTVKSDINEVNITAADNNINFLTNTSVTGDLQVAGNVSIDGTLISLGNQISDTLDFEMEFISDIIPNTDSAYNLGSTVKNWDNVYTREFVVGDITISDNYIVANQSNVDLIIQGNGTGRVVMDNLRFKTLVDSVSGNININNTTRSSIFTGNAVQLPVGTIAQRPSTQADLRFNNISNQFEGYNTAPVLLGGVRDLDGGTRIDVTGDEFLHYANNVYMGKVSTTGDLIVNRFSSQNQFALDNNTVTVGSVTPGTVAALTANGSGVVRFDTSNHVFNLGTIKNTVTNSDTQFLMTGTLREQYVHFSANSKGVRVPYGSTVARNPGVIGELYWNTTQGILQVYDGTAWFAAAGISGSIVPQSQVEEINTIYNLILA